MTLSFTAIDDGADLQDFSCDLDNLEDALDILSVVALDGHTIVKAYILDEGNRIELPAAVFDGKPISRSVKKLEKQWQTILKKPVRSSVLTDKWLLDITRRRIKLFDDQIAILERTISRFETLRQRAGEKRYGPQRMRLIHYYDSTLATYRGYAYRSETGRQAMLKKLQQLESYYK